MEHPQQGTILIVDDIDSSPGLCTRLSDAGYHCFAVDTPSKALAQLSSRPIDVAILDVMTPDQTGLDLLTELVAKYPGTAVIAISGDVQPEIVVECMKRGAQDYLFKPLDLDAVIRRIEEVFRKRQIDAMLRAYQTGLEDKVADQAEKIRKLYLDSLDTLVTALEAKDAYTAGHSRRVGRISVAIAERMGFSPEQIDDLHWGALLHDVGKLAIDPRVQNKPDKLTVDEYAQVMQHTLLGPRIVKAIVSENILNMLQFHHRRYDSDNPDNPHSPVALSTRIITLADAFDAMTSDRPYRPGMTVEEAITEVMRCSGTQFDPSVVAAFLAVPLSELKEDISDHQAPGDNY